MAKRISRVLGACALASLMGCASEPTVSSLTSVERQRVGEMVVVNAGAIPRDGYQILGSAEGVACKKYTYSESPTIDQAMQDVRIRAARLGAEALTNLVCESHQQKDWTRNCWETVVCTGDAITVPDKSVLSRLKQEGETDRAGMGGSKGTANASSSEQSQRVIAGSTANGRTSGSEPAGARLPAPLEAEANRTRNKQATLDEETDDGVDAAIVSGQQRNAAVMRALAAQMARNQGYGSSPIVGGQVLSPSGNTQSKQRQPVENMNRCKQIRFIKRSSFDVWEFSNNCPVPVSVAYCSKAGCKSPTSAMEIPAGSKDNSPTLGQTSSELGAVLYCPVNSFNTTSGGVWACWPKN